MSGSIRRWMRTTPTRGIVEFNEGEEVLTPKINERFGSYDLNEAACCDYFLSNHIQKGGVG